MNDSSRFKFLGTAGARFVVARQLRSSGGVFIESAGKKIILDPGPGTLVHSAASRPRIDITGIDGIILTHNHIDHSNDVNVLIDGMTSGGLRRRGVLFAPAECLEGKHAVVLNYLKGFLEDIVVLEEARDYALGGLRFRTSVRHDHPAETYGIRFDMDGRRVSFLVDTEYFPGLVDDYAGSDLLVMHVVRDTPFEDPTIRHLTLDGVRKLLEGIRPRAAFLTHFGIHMLEASPRRIAAGLTRETGIRVTAAADGMTVDIGEALKPD